MVKPRVVETDTGITGPEITQAYDQMQRRFRDKGIIETKDIIKSGIDSGAALEIGCGPGYVGLEWLKLTQGTTLTGLEISPDMKALAEKNAAEYNLVDRAGYVLGDAAHMPLEDDRFDAAFSTGSFHEWAAPLEVLREIARVLKPGGRFYIGDLRRDANPLIKLFMRMMVKPKVIRPGLVTSLKAAYTPDEVRDMLASMDFAQCEVKSNPFGLSIRGRTSS
jgi:ubiquinone/menaquinone biosynthesis C-methylase UbiE